MLSLSLECPFYFSLLHLIFFISLVIILSKKPLPNLRWAMSPMLRFRSPLCTAERTVTCSCVCDLKPSPLPHSHPHICSAFIIVPIKLLPVNWVLISSLQCRCWRVNHICCSHPLSRFLALIQRTVNWIPDAKMHASSNRGAIHCLRQVSLSLQVTWENKDILAHGHSPMCGALILPPGYHKPFAF